ncbi:Non-reducing end alpha-L-arabinofuranosidase [Psidium guajava]|nr:Non-reducing end alpha-L-arabinofuranosidase [Psidium guajava]
MGSKADTRPNPETLREVEDTPRTCRCACRRAPPPANHRRSHREEIFKRGRRNSVASNPKPRRDEALP